MVLLVFLFKKLLNYCTGSVFGNMWVQTIENQQENQWFWKRVGASKAKALVKPMVSEAWYPSTSGEAAKTNAIYIVYEGLRYGLGPSVG